jgi:hypothetical protein
VSLPSDRFGVKPWLFKCNLCRYGVGDERDEDDLRHSLMSGMNASRMNAIHEVGERGLCTRCVCVQVNERS